ncbi:ABC transporter ATP-binding protein/permease [Hornefia butyriciproducens]|uniref:ABC transporter ATP-binding protein/permease n=1 Tax=Hornefia butyriciproducens TaxID=2652293 RepID=UPI002A911D6D|nr:ABC transporter ATP-binding protein/permease [Hornefia butyriciproducens]MDY5462772.1 ABC transporter ATP-binding protein/permease [Hornefia butyriciproducens]
MPHMIEMRKVSKFYSGHDTVSTGFSKVDLNLDIGEFVVITGESGGGKSTLLNVISGLDTYEEGEMFVAGQDTSAFRTEDYENYRKTYIGNIFQDYNLINSYTVYQNVELAMLLNGRKKRELKSGIMGILRWLGLRDYARTRVSRLSGGQKQRVAIARAFAKDAPIIVADEPTGNLDSESAALVMETLYKISRDKLVIVVTHNYEQAEPYATRRIMMRDGRIIEDQKLKPVQNVEQESEAVAGKEAKKKRTRLSAISELRLGIRNTFNLPAKFLLLLFIYLFVSTAVLGGYSALMNQEHEVSLQGSNQYFYDTSPERIVLHRQDQKAFTAADYKKIEGMANIDHIVKNDLALDRVISLESQKIYVEGPAYSVSTISSGKLSFGRLPKKANEIVVGVNDMSEAYESLKEMGEKILGKRYYLDTYNVDEGTGGRISDKKVRVVGVILNDEEDSRAAMYAYSRIYVTDELANRILVSTVATSSGTTLTMNGKIVSRNNAQAVFISDRVSPGNVWICEDDAESYYKDGKAVGYPLKVKITNRYFTSRRTLKVSAVFKADNMQSLLGYQKSDYDTYAQCIFVNSRDFNRLFDRGNYQISAYMKNEVKSDATMKALKSAGYQPLSMKSVLSDTTQGTAFINKIFSRVLLGILFIALFFIAYAVIRLIMRSRNTYYSTLRILGASRGNTANLLRIELLMVMLIAVALVMGFVTLVNQGILPLTAVKNFVSFMRPRYYSALFIIMLVMSLLISERYSRKIFKKSAMNVYRGEA